MENQTVTPTGIIKQVQKSAITVDKIEKNIFGKLTAHLRQTVTNVATYPGKQVANDLNASLFSAGELGYKPSTFASTENRVVFQEVPEGTTSEMVSAKLAANPQACLYKMLSNQPILTSGQKHNIADPNNALTLGQVANSQVVRYPKDTKKEGIDVSGQIVLDINSKPQYRKIFLSLTGIDDQDLRDNSAENIYLTPEMKGELQGASAMSEAQVVW